MLMKIFNKKKLMLLGVALLVGISGATAQTVDTADSSQVEAFNTTSEEIAFEFSNISEENVEVWLYHNGELQATTGEIPVDISGIATYTLNNYTQVDQIKVAPVESDVSSVEQVTLYYDYVGTGELENTTNYNGNTVFSDFTVTTGAMNALQVFIPFAMLLFIVGLFTNKSN